MVDIAQTPVYGLASPVVTNFQWSASNTTAVPAASTALPSPPPDSLVTVTAGSGVTSLTALVQATNDNTNWTTIGTLRLTAPGAAALVIGIPYLGLRVNVSALSGGNASATLTAGGAPLAASGGIVVSNPQLTGVPAPAAALAYQWGTPVILPSSGSIGNNGALTLTTALPAIFPNCWMYFPAGAIASGSAAGVYFVQMSSTTAGTIYNNVLSSGMPFIPASPTPFVTTGPGAYTQTTSGNPTLVSVPVLGGSMGNNGALRYKGVWLTAANANVKSQTIYLGSTVIATTNFSSANFIGVERTLRNMGSQSSQMAINATANFQTDATVTGTGSPSFLGVDTSANQNMLWTAFISTATDYCILAGATVEILPAA